MNVVEKFTLQRIDPLAQFDVWKAKLDGRIPKRHQKLFESECAQTLEYLETTFPRIPVPTNFNMIVLVPKPVWVKRANETLVGRIRRKFMRRSSEWRWYTRSLSFVNDLLRKDLSRIDVSLRNHLLADPWISDADASDAELNELHQYLGLRQRTEDAFDALSKLQDGAFWVVPVSYHSMKISKGLAEIVDDIPENYFQAPILVAVCMIWSSMNSTSLLSDLEVLGEDFSIEIDCLGDKYTRQVDVRDDEKRATSINWSSHQLKVGAIRESRLWIDRPQVLIDRPQVLHPLIGFIPKPTVSRETRIVE